MRTGDRERAVANGEAHPFGGAGANVAGGQDAWDRGFEWARGAVFERPASRSLGVDAGEHVTEFVARGGVWEPLNLRLGAYENEQRGQVDPGIRSVVAVRKGGGADARIAVYFDHLGVVENLNMGGCADTIGKVLGH